MKAAHVPATVLQTTAAGVVIGIVYVLSPLTLLFLVAIVPLIYFATRGLDDPDRRRVAGILVLAITLRLLAVAILFLTTDHSRVAFGTFFGDEDYFIDRSLWLRNVALGIPLHPADLVKAYESANESGYLYGLSLIQTLFGPSPYGLHLLGILCYVAAVVLLFRLVRTTLGRVPALLGLIALLFLPSLFAWSVSVLKEPSFVLGGAVIVVAAARLLRALSWTERVLVLTTVVLTAAGLEGIRQGGGVLIGLAAVIGLSIAFVATRPRLMLAVVVAMPILVAATLSRPDAQLRVFTAIRGAASQHWAYVTLTPGYGYKLLDERLYSDTSDLSDMGLGETMRFVVRAIVAYVTVPLPWDVQSRGALVYLPEQVVWYVLVLLACAGALVGFRRNPAVTALLIGQATAIAIVVALTSGNVGTLVRHRGLVLPYMIWLSAVGFCELLTFGVSHPAGPVAGPAPDLALSRT